MVGWSTNASFWRQICDDLADLMRKCYENYSEEKKKVLKARNRLKNIYNIDNSIKTIIKNLE